MGIGYYTGYVSIKAGVLEHILYIVYVFIVLEM